MPWPLLFMHADGFARQCCTVRTTTKHASRAECLRARTTHNDGGRHEWPVLLRSPPMCRRSISLKLQAHAPNGDADQTSRLVNRFPQRAMGNERGSRK